LNKERKMKTTIPKLRRIIRKVLIEHVGDEHHEHGGGSHRKEPAEGYVQDHADMYADSAEGFDGYLDFGMQYGYTEDQLGEWFDIAYEAQYQAHVDAMPVELVRKGSLDLEQLEADFDSGYIDLEKRPYQLD
tara:strand:+ start:224 stop:619 length:396 start_codon:yes stop_codon:yes gene_type:complete